MITVENLTPQKGTYKDNVFNYGTVKRGADMNMEIALKSDTPIKHTSIKAQCGCTTPMVTQINSNQINIKIDYNSNLLGAFNKWVEETYKIDGKQQTFRFNITGIVTQ